MTTVPDAPFGRLVAGLDAALVREERGLDALDRIEAGPVRLGDGVAYARDEVARAIELTRQARALIAALEAVEPQVRALLARLTPSPQVAR